VLVLDQFNPVPERICDVTTPHARNAGIVGNLNPIRFESADRPVIVKTPQRRMRLSRRTKIRFHAKDEPARARIQTSTHRAWPTPQA
jgi:hypothetical protein